MTDGGEELPTHCPNDEELLEPRERGGGATVECPQCGYESTDPLPPARRRYKELQTEYHALIDRHQELKSMASEAEKGSKRQHSLNGRAEELIPAIRTIEELLNDWNASDEDSGRVMTDGGEDIDEEPPRWRDWSNVKEENESGRLMTDGGSDELPDLSRFEVGNDVRVFYRSQRSGNEVDREGTVSEVIEADDGPVVRVHTGEPEPFKHIYMALTEAESKDGEVRVHAFSQTTEPDGMDWEDGPDLGMSYVLQFSISRNTYLGPVDRVVRTDSSTPIMMTDGGRDIPVVSGVGFTFSGPGDELRRCPDCDTPNNMFVNDTRCYKCGYRWGSGGEVIDDGDDDGSHPDDEGVELITDGGCPVREHEEHRTLMGEYNPEEWNPEPDPDYHGRGSVSIHDPIEGEAYSEPGHWADRPADMDSENARRLALRGEFDDLGENQPLPLISSDMRGVPTEGIQGSYSVVRELDEPCPECEQEFGIRSVVTMAGVHRLKCLVCNHVIEEG